MNHNANTFKAQDKLSNDLVATSLVCEDDFKVEYTIVQPSLKANSYEKQQKWVQSQIDELDDYIKAEDESFDKLTNEIDNIYTVDLDKLDYSMAVASGLICGAIDSLFIGEFDFFAAREKVEQQMEQKIIDLAKKRGWKGVEKGSRKGQFPLDRAISFLEGNDNNVMPSDSLMNVFGGSRQHHLRDFAHHHSLIGLLFSILTQFTGKAYGTDTNGVFITYDVPNEMIGTDIKRKFAIAVTNWTLHLASDMHGSSGSAGNGTGVPGPIVSFIKAISALPIWGTKPHVPGEKPNPNSLSIFTAKLYNGSLLAQKDESGNLVPVKIDLRGELAIKQELGRQAIPVIINDILVRVFYLIRRLFIELKTNQIKSWDDITQLNWRKIVPIANRSIVRLMTIASGTFVTVDMGDAAIRGAVLSGGNLGNFAKQLLMRVNFVGIGRFAIAIGTDAYMGHKQLRLLRERADITYQLLTASNAKLLYRQADTWIAAEQAEDSIEMLYHYAEQATPFIYSFTQQVGYDFRNLPSLMKGIGKKNPDVEIAIKTIFKI